MKTTEAPQTNIEQNVQNDDKEEFGDFVEIKEEKNDSGQQPKDTQNFYEASHDFDFGMGAGLGESEKKAPIQDWNFESGIGQNKYDQVEIETEQHNPNNNDNNGDDAFDDFEQAQEAKLENIEVNKKEENDDFAEFQFEPASQNKEGENQWGNGGFGGEIKWNESKQEKDEGFDFGDFQEENSKKETIKDAGGLDGFDFGNVNVNANTGQDNKNAFFEMDFDQKGVETEQKETNENKDDMWNNFDQGFEGFNKIEEKVKETKVDEENEGREKKEDGEGFDDFEEYTEPKKVENENNFDDFQWNDAPVQQEKVEEDNEQNKQEEFDDEGFGDFEGGKTEEKETKVENNEDVKEVNNPTFEKKVTIYDIDFTGKKNISNKNETNR